MKNMQGQLISVEKSENSNITKMTFLLENGGKYVATIPDLSKVSNKNWIMFSKDNWINHYFKGLDVMNNKIVGSSNIKAIAKGQETIGKGYIYLPKQKTLWKGILGFREKFVKQMTTENKNMVIEYVGNEKSRKGYGKGKMIIFRHDYKILKHSLKEELDKFGRPTGTGRLVYFEWVVNVDPKLGTINYNNKY